MGGYILLNFPSSFGFKKKVKNNYTPNKDEAHPLEHLNLFNRLKGPLNDYGFLLNCPIKHKWIYNDFNLYNKEIYLKQGYKINEFFNLESFQHNIINNDDYIIFDIFNNI